MSQRAIKSNTYVTSTNFPYFLQNQSSCKTVIIHIFQQVNISPSSKGYCGHSVSQKKIRNVFLNSGDQTCLSKYIFKWVVLELIAPIYKREKSSIHSCFFFFFPTRSALHCSRWGCRQTLHWSFPSLVRLSLSLTNAGILLISPSSTTKVGWRCTRGRPDSIPDWFSSIPQKPLFDLSFSLMLPRWSTVDFQNISQASIARGSLHLMCAHAHSWVQSWPQ